MKKNILIMLITLLTFSLTFIACGDLDNKLNGTWTYSESGITAEMEFDKGDYTMRALTIEMQKGTYTTDDGSITMTPTEIFVLMGGGLLNKTAYKKYLTDDLGYSVAEADAEVAIEFAPYTSKYSVKGKELTLTNDSGVKTTLTKK